MDPSRQQLPPSARGGGVDAMEMDPRKQQALMQQQAQGPPQGRKAFHGHPQWGAPHHGPPGGHPSNDAGRVYGRPPSAGGGPLPPSQMSNFGSMGSADGVNKQGLAHAVGHGGVMAASTAPSFGGSAGGPASADHGAGMIKSSASGVRQQSPTPGSLSPTGRNGGMSLGPQGQQDGSMSDYRSMVGNGAPGQFMRPGYATSGPGHMGAASMQHQAQRHPAIEQSRSAEEHHKVMQQQGNKAVGQRVMQDQRLRASPAMDGARQDHEGKGPVNPQQQGPRGQQPQQPWNHRPPAPAAKRQEEKQGMKELRVEDALLYLDDVKREFKHRPAIYNEFLSIMKNFKTQEVDTPGVIARVSSLFRGYNNLILGFNTFLPDSHKISLADLQRQEAEEAAREQALRVGGKANKPAQPSRAKQQNGPAVHGAPFQQQPPQAQAPRQVQQQQQPSPPAPPPPPQQQQQQQQQAQWSHEDSPRQQPAAPPAAPQQQQAPAQKQKQASTKQGKQQQQSTSQGQQGSSPSKKSQQRGSGQGQQQQQQQQQQPHQAVEFDHAISYVTTIKRRFANDPGTYHTFLEILHTYQKEQRGIKEVLEQVAVLFQDHPDLLKEFTFFLPDAVQEQAKERLHRAAAESESRQAAQRQQQAEQNSQKTKLIDMTQSKAASSEAEGRSRKRPLEAQPVQAAQPPPPIQQQQPPHQPESYVYNSAVERQFFDSAREALSSFTRDGGQAWAEFLKCLDMYAQDILSRSEMLHFVEPLLGKRNTKLFDEFKRILNAAGSLTGATHLMEDSWYSVPLSEIDFSRCRRCTPSYRGLPRDYPDHPCSGRSELESKVLNDTWVSLPVGSEESYTFRHMRRNTYEETLFRVEDERFEIDMVIDSNAATLQLLKPIAEEIAQLSQEDVLPADMTIKTPEGAGLGGRRYQYTFDKRILGVIHRNVIRRIYGDSGQEIIDLMVKNPTVAVPLVVQRLSQKDEEWRAVRVRLNRTWRELAEHNYYKSLDHRGLTWRTTDKRATSTRTLIAEIKDRAANRGHESKEALKQKMEKAKEEHGLFYEVTKGSSLSEDLDLTFLPKPDRRLFTPHLSLMYENNSWAQRDAYRILVFALERGPISPADKERCHRLWMEFLCPWFNLSLNWIQQPAVSYQDSTAKAVPVTPASQTTVVSEDDEEESMDDDHDLEGNIITEEMRDRPSRSKGRDFTDHHPLPAGAHVSTLYGEGRIVEFRRSDHIYKVQLGFGAIGYLRPATVLCSMIPVEKSAFTRQLRTTDMSKLARAGDQLALGTQSLYLFLRLHQVLINRLNTAKKLAYSVDNDESLKTLVEQMPLSNAKAVGRQRYESYLSLVYALLDGGVGGAAEGGKYEDRVRTLLGHGAYELATMDKLISNIWKNLQAMAGDETMWNLIQLYRRHAQEGSFQPDAFRQEAAYLSDGEPLFAFQHCPISGTDESVLHIEFLDVIMEDGEEGIDEAMSGANGAASGNEMGVEYEGGQASSTEPPPKRFKR